MYDTHKLKALTHKVTVCLDEMKEQVDRLRDFLGQRTFIDNADIQLIVTKADDFVKLQDDLRSEFKSVFPSETVPALLDDIEDKIRELDKAIAKQKEFDEAKKVVERFGNITSDFADCKDMLKKYLTKLKAISTEQLSVEEYKELTKPYNLFFDAVKTSDLNTRVSQARNIVGSFDSEIINKLIFGEYYITNRQTADEKTLESPSPQHEAAAVTYSTPVFPTVQSDIPATAETDGPVSEIVPGNTATVPDDEPEKLSEPDAASFPFRIGTRDELGMVTIVSRKSSNPPDHRIFKALMKNQFNKFVFTQSVISSTIDSMNFRFKPDEKKKIEAAAECLVTEGYLNTVSLNNMPPVYHINTRGFKAAKRYAINVSSKFNVFDSMAIDRDYSKFNANTYINELGYSKTVFYGQNLLRLIAEQGIKAELNRLTEYIGKNHSVLYTDYNVNGKTGLNILIVSACIANLEEADELLTNLRTEADYDNENYNYLFIASDNFDECSRCLDFISGLTEKTKSSKIIFFSATENNYRYNNEIIDSDQIIDILKASSEEIFGFSFPSKKDFEEECKSSGIITGDHSDVGKVTIIANDDKSVATRVFKKDMKILAFASAVSALSENSEITETFLRKHKRITKKSFGDSSVMEKLFEKGYVNKLILEGYEPIYNTSNVYERCMNKTNVNWLKANYKFSFKPQTVTPSSERLGPDDPYFTNIFLTRFGMLTIASSIVPDLPVTSSSSTLTPNNFLTFCSKKITLHRVKINIFLISACIPETSVISDFTKFADVFLKKQNCDFDILFISGFNEDECDSYFRYLKNNYGYFEKAKYIRYIIGQQRFNNGDDGSDTDHDGIQEYIKELLTNRSAYGVSEVNNQTPADEEAEEIISEQEEMPAYETETNAGTYSPEPDTAPVAEENLPEDDEPEIDTESPEALPDFPEEQPFEDNSYHEPVYDDYTYQEIADIKQEAIDKEQLMETLCSLLENKKYSCASAYLRAVSLSSKSYTQLCTALGYAMDDPATQRIYTSSMISGTFDNESGSYSELTDFFKICAVLRTLFHGNPHDYQYKALYAAIQGHSYLNDDNKDVAELLYNLSKFKDTTNGIGIDTYADYRIVENFRIEEMIENCVSKAKMYFDYYYNNPIKEKKTLRRYLDTIKLILKKDAMLYDCLLAVSEDDRSKEILEYIKEFMVTNFIDSSCSIRAANINYDKLNKFIDYNWEEAGRIQREKHKSSKLVQELRTNLISMLSKMLTEIADWYYYVSLYTENYNRNEYEHEKRNVLKVIERALQTCDEISNSGDRDRYTKAGNACIYAVLKEFKDKLEGTFIDNANKYYYADFLFSGEVMLDENFIPIIENELAAIKDFSPVSRILRHSNYANRDINERINEIFNRTPDYDLFLSDDYGCADLIKEYLKNTQGVEWDDVNNDITANSADASKQMNLIKSSFIGTLELDQSYGKIDIDHKDRLLLLVDRQYKKAMKSHNFGFFKRMLAYCKNTVDENARKRKDNISVHLNNVKNAYSNIPEANEMLENAERMMDMQNYTVVEDIINRIQQHDFSNKSVLDSEDHLDNFIREYNEIFNILYKKPSNTSLINRITRFNNSRKHSHFAAEIINNFPSDSKKLNKFLEAIGFNVIDITQYADKQSCFDVSIKKPINGKRENYLHPIYPFGSYAVEKGFRVLCLLGKTDYNNILDAINEVGTSKSTIIIVDWALALHDRRELARKIKATMPDDNIFIVIDKVAMYYLADKNEESTSSVNRILMQISAPFASFQPYTEDASKAISSEMFMGRTKLLREIESPKGANVICGGRQLGKSALLRMAKSDINDDISGSRAVYVEIKKLDYKQAALKVSQKLIDENILDYGCKTDDWDEMTRFIKLRLNDSTKNQIPFFLLLMDEADTLFESSKHVDYSPIRALESLQADGMENFKFVFAGLRNLVKFERELATNDNSTLPHITVKTIKPFSAQEARELLEVPLHYLGIRFPKDKEYLVSLILASTNYFPGLIHQYCAYLIKALQETDYADYTVDKTPPYELTETQIKKILSDENFTKEIKNKFEITLKLDTDNYYDIIATLLAYCSYNENSADGFTVQEIMSVAEDYEIEKIVSQGIDKLNALMEELCELNILRKNNENRYLFARHNFIQMLGKDQSEIDEKLIQYLGA